MQAYWREFQKHNSQYRGQVQPSSFYFCDNKIDADSCAELVVQNIKRATSPSLWRFTKHQEPLPKIGDLSIITSWDGEPKAIVRSTKIEIVKYKDVSAHYAFIEGEGDRSLEYWQKVHWQYYTLEMAAFDEVPSVDMEIVCVYFERIW